MTPVRGAGRQTWCPLHWSGLSSIAVLGKAVKRFNLQRMGSAIRSMRPKSHVSGRGFFGLSDLFQGAYGTVDLRSPAFHRCISAPYVRRGRTGRSFSSAGPGQDLLHDVLIHQLQIGRQDMTVHVRPEHRHIGADVSVGQVVGGVLIANDAV